jgi:predicted nucleic acid-binding protein
MGQLSLVDAARVYIDTVTIIYAVEQAPVYGKLLSPLWNSLQAGSLEVLTSELTLMEALIVPLRNSDIYLVDAYERILQASQIRLISVSMSILKESARLRAALSSLRTPDAIHAATALGVQCTHFLTNDRRLKAVPGLPVVLLDEVLAS